MPGYRLYFIDGHSGHIVRSLDFGADDDPHAIARAGELEGAKAMELWCGTHKVHHWEVAAAASPDPISA